MAYCPPAQAKRIAAAKKAAWEKKVASQKAAKVAAIQKVRGAK